MQNREGSWEEKFLDAFSRGCLPKDKRQDIPEVVLVGLGIQRNNEELLLKPLSKVKKTGQFYIGKYNEVPLAVVCQDMGALATEITVRVLSKTPAKVIVGVGFAGALQGSIKMGDVILPTAAMRGEGTTRYYAPENVAAAPSAAIQETLEKALPQETPVHKGPVYTTAALIKEETQLISKLNREGILGIECETSALFLISQLCGIQAGAVLAVSDNPFLNQLWLDSGANKQIRRGLSQSVKAAYDAAETLSANYNTPQQGKSRRLFR
ncbi:MAG: hypothetical protein NWF05_07205 [Candidatus Bathyarchaeota archaeon]|nr:hypothetical protein [Candidatus Bathyarchaeota archaeon]